MVKIKSFCQLHHLYYEGSVCPLCEKARINRIGLKYGQTGSETPEKKKEKPDREITEDDLEKLANKFNVR